MARIIKKRNSKKKVAYYGKFVNFYKGGYSVTQITKMLPVTNVTLYSWLHEAIENGELVKSEVKPLPLIAPAASETTPNAPIQKLASSGVYLPQEPSATAEYPGLERLVSEVAKAVLQPQEPKEDDYSSMSKEELIAVISNLKKEKNEDEIKIKAYQTLIEIAGSNIGDDLLKKAGARQSGA